MIRPFELKFNGVILVKSEDSPQLLKDATFYLGKKFEKVTDVDFKKWLEERRDKGYMESDIRDLRDDIFRGDFNYLIPKVEELPNYVSEVIDYLLEENKMLKKKKRN